MRLADRPLCASRVHRMRQTLMNHLLCSPDPVEFEMLGERGVGGEPDRPTAHNLAGT